MFRIRREIGRAFEEPSVSAIHSAHDFTRPAPRASFLFSSASRTGPDGVRPGFMECLTGQFASGVGSFVESVFMAHATLPVWQHRRTRFGRRLPDSTVRAAGNCTTSNLDLARAVKM